MGREPLYPYKARLGPLYWPYRALRVFTCYCCFAGFWLGCIVAAWLVLPIVALWPGSPAQKIARGLRCTRFGFRVFHFAAHTLRFYTRTSPAKSLRPGDKPVVIVANHPTLCDVTSIVSMFPNTVALARIGLANNPLISRAVRLCGFIAAGNRVLADCEERLRMGFDVLVCPEGTRTPMDGPLHPFQVAMRAKVPIVLVKLAIEPSALSKRLPVWKIPDKMALLTIEPFDIVDPTKYSDSRALCRAVEQRYSDLLYPALGQVAPIAKSVGDVQ